MANRDVLVAKIEGIYYYIGDHPVFLSKHHLPNSSKRLSRLYPDILVQILPYLIIAKIHTLCGIFSKIIYLFFKVCSW